MRTIEPTTYGARYPLNWSTTEIQYWFSPEPMMPRCANLQPKDYNRLSST